jgi:hypothetical protein
VATQPPFLLRSDDFAQGRAAFRYSLERGNRFLRLDVSRVRSIEELVGRRVRLTGRRSGEVFVVEEASRARRPAARRPAAAAATERRVAVILVNFMNDSSTPIARPPTA